MPRVMPPIPIPVARGLRLLGADIRAARRRRRLRTLVVAERARISRPTLLKVERGDPSVSLGVYATVLWVLGLLDRLPQVAAPAADTEGLELETARLPARIRPRRTTPEV
jgi:transcriptional regulator with XRE-family HTH domain